MAFRCAGRGAKQKPSEFVLLPETARFPSLPPLILAPFSREGGGQDKESSCRTVKVLASAAQRAHRRRTAVHFFSLLRFAARFQQRKRRRRNESLTVLDFFFFFFDLDLLPLPLSLSIYKETKKEGKSFSLSLSLSLPLKPFQLVLLPRVRGVDV